MRETDEERESRITREGVRASNNAERRDVESKAEKLLRNEQSRSSRRIKL